MNEKNKSEAILIINGEISLAWLLDYIERHKMQTLPMFCSDGAFNTIKLSPNLLNQVQCVYGDLDSMNTHHITQNDNITFTELLDQYKTDFDKTLEQISDDFDTIYIFGASGKEMDHYLGNVSVAMRYFEKISLFFIDQYSMYRCVNGDKEDILLKNVKHRMISIVPLFKMNEVTLKGLRYTLNRGSLDFEYNLGIRNYAIEDEVSIKASGRYLIFISHDDYQGLVSE